VEPKEWPDDGRWTWSYLSAQIAAQDELDDDLRSGALGAVDRLESHLGPAWPTTRPPGLHPLDELVGNMAPWTRQRLIDIARVMDAVQSDPHWRRSLLGRVRHPREAENALLELDLARVALDAGLTVHLQPSSVGEGRADLLVTDSRAGILVEITRVEEFSVAGRDDLAFYNQLCPVLELVVHNLEFGCDVLEEVPLEDRPQLLEELRAFWNERMETHTAGRLEKPGLLIAWARPLDLPTLPTADSEPQLTHSFNAPFQDNSWLRVARAVRRKAAGLPADGQTLLILSPPATLFAGYPLSRIGLGLRSVLHQQHGLAGLALTGRAPRVAADALRAESGPEARIAVIPESGIWVRWVVIVLDSSRATPLSEGLLLRWLP
jgi:hypothetical protein